MRKDNIDIYLSKISMKIEPIHSYIPFPQANDVSKIFNFISYTKRGHILKEELIKDFSMTDRQIDYYGNACRYIGLTFKDEKEFLLTSKGQKFSTADINTKNKIFIDSCMEIPSIRESFEIYLKDKDNALHNIQDVLKKHNVLDIDCLNATIKRRAQGLISWLKYIDIHFDRLI